jgi:hypothetical protein
MYSFVKNNNGILASGSIIDKQAGPEAARSFTRFWGIAESGILIGLI